MKNIMTLQQANALIERADSLFRRAALAWERGNNSGNEEANQRGQKRCEKMRNEAEELLRPLGISVDYPGLYPSFTVGGYSHHTTESAVSAALAMPETMTDDFGHECAEVRVLPSGGGGNILCGRRGYEREMNFRRERIRAGVPFDLPAWESLEVYFPKGSK